MLQPAKLKVYMNVYVNPAKFFSSNFSVGTLTLRSFTCKFTMELHNRVQSNIIVVD